MGRIKLIGVKYVKEDAQVVSLLPIIVILVGHTMVMTTSRSLDKILVLFSALMELMVTHPTTPVSNVPTSHT